MEKKMVANGSVVISAQTFHYEFWSDNVEVLVKMSQRGKNGKSTEFISEHKTGLKQQMQDALMKAQLIKKA